MDQLILWGGLDGAFRGMTIAMPTVGPNSHVGGVTPDDESRYFHGKATRTVACHLGLQARVYRCTGVGFSRPPGTPCLFYCRCIYFVCISQMYIRCVHISGGCHGYCKSISQRHRRSLSGRRGPRRVDRRRAGVPAAVDVGPLGARAAARPVRAGQPAAGSRRERPAVASVAGRSSLRRWSHGCWSLWRWGPSWPGFARPSAAARRRTSPARWR